MGTQFKIKLECKIKIFDSLGLTPINSPVYGQFAGNGCSYF